FSGGSWPETPADGAAARAVKVVLPSRGPASVIAPVVQSPIGLVQLSVVNTLWIVPCTGLHVTGGGGLILLTEATVPTTTPRAKIATWDLLKCLIGDSPLRSYTAFSSANGIGTHAFRFGPLFPTCHCNMHDYVTGSGRAVLTQSRSCPMKGAVCPYRRFRRCISGRRFLHCVKQPVERYERPPR